jgi:hypothetical protein
MICNCANQEWGKGKPPVRDRGNRVEVSLHISYHKFCTNSGMHNLARIPVPEYNLMSGGNVNGQKTFL